MKQIILAALTAIALTGCMSTAAYDRDQAYTACEAIQDKDKKDTCIEDAMATAAADRRDFEADINAERDAAERRQAEREALGVPRDDARQSSDSGLRIPN